MEDTISSKKLKKDALSDFDDMNLDIYNNIRKKDKLKRIYDDVSENYYDTNDSEVSNSKIKIKMKTKLIIKLFLCTLILFSCLVCKLLLYDQAMSNKYIASICKEYKVENKKENVLEKIEQKASIINNTFDYAIPDLFSSYISNKYFLIKPKILDFNLKDSIHNLIFSKKEDNNNDSDTSSDENTGVGGGGPIEEQKSTSSTNEQEVVSSSTSVMDQDVANILSKNISIIKPTQGTITSRYGVREQIFEGVNPYHTGIDIANKIGTNIYSATTGKVVTVNQNDKYYGKMVLIETSGVIFKYGHMSEIKVEQGQELKQSDLIGLMGQTGYATGSHLHFEIRIDNRSVDPERILSFGE